jgi:CheY-like chemotaxis protein
MFRPVARSILLVDDDPDVRALLGEFLLQHGYEVHAARDGRHALQLLAKMEPPALILLDYVMPALSGSQFLERKRWNPRLRGIPVVILSAWTRQWSPTKLDAVDVLSKPVDLDRLLALVTHICDGSHAVHVPLRRERAASPGSIVSA